jgi:hypothetical protein
VAESENSAINNTGAANVVASGFAVAIDDSTAISNNSAEATGAAERTFEQVIPCPPDSEDDLVCTEPVTVLDQSSAFAVGGAVAANNSTAIQSATALGTDGGDASAEANAFACIDPLGRPMGSDCTSIANAEANALKGADAFAETEAISLNGGTAVADSTQNATGVGSAAGGAAIALANGENNLAVATAAGDASNGFTSTTGSVATSNVLTSSQFGAGVAKSVSCTEDQVSCGTGIGIALASGSQGGIAVADSTGLAVDANTYGVAAANAGAACPGAVAASYVVNPDGSYTYELSSNAGFACSSADSSVTP